jgi:HK97 family phage major capsid protein
MPEIKKDEFAQLVKDQVGEVITEQNAGFQEEIKAQITDSLKEMKDEVKSHAMKFQVDPDRKENPSGYGSFADFAQDVFKCGRQGHGLTDKMKTYQERTKAAGDGMSAFDGESGGYLIPDEFRTSLLQIAVDKTNILQQTMKIPMSSNSIDIPYVSGFDRSGGLIHGGVQFKWLEEEEQRTETKPKMGRIGLKLKKVAGLCFATDEILEDSPISMEPLLRAAFTDALAWTLDGVFVSGTGAGQPLGILNAPCLVSVAKESGRQQIQSFMRIYSKCIQDSGELRVLCGLQTVMHFLS